MTRPLLHSYGTLPRRDAVIRRIRWPALGLVGLALSLAFVNRHSPTYAAVRELVDLAESDSEA